MLSKKRQIKISEIVTIGLILTLSFVLSGCSFVCSFCKAPPIQQEGLTLLDGKGSRTDTIDIFDNLRVGVKGLEPGTRYTLRVVDADGRQLSYSRLTAGRDGVIPVMTLLFGENLFPCKSYPVETHFTVRSVSDDDRDFILPEKRVMQRVADVISSLRDTRHYVEVLEGKHVVRRVPFSIKDNGKPKIYVADSSGCLKGGLLQGEDDIYVVGRNFPAGSLVNLYGVEDQRIWKEGDPFRDVTGINGAPGVESVQLARGQRDFFARIWSKKSTTTGLYDVIARYKKKKGTKLDAQDVISADGDVGFLIQADAAGDPHIEQNMTVPLGVYYYMFQDKYFNTDDVWVAVNPKDRPGGGEQNARIYVVNHLDESQWLHGTALTDVSTDGYEEVPIKGSCRNQNEIRIWEAPLVNGNYDVVVDFAPFGVYDQGQDIIDELDNVGFEVVDSASLAIVYPINDLRVFPEKEVPTGYKKDYIYAVVKIDPAASGTTIYWDSIDIDDPSSDAAPVDPNGATGDDNRGNYGAVPGTPDGDDGLLQGEDAGGIATVTTNSIGIAYALFRVTTQPGDNFTLRASTSPTFASFDESAPVTVWRRLHVEIDSMGAPSGTTVTGNITGVAPAGGGQSNVTVDVVLDDGSAASTGGRFENGILTAGGIDYTVISNTSSVVRVVGTPTNGASFVLADDDVVPADVAEPDVNDMVRAYSRAFILPVFDTGEDTGDVTFDLNTESAERSTQINLGKGTPTSTEDYWTVTVHGGFQEPVNSDNDPDDEGTSRAWAIDSVQGAITLNESIRDWIQAPATAGGAGGVDPDPNCEAGRSLRRQEILDHEVGHLLSLGHPDGAIVAGVDDCGGVMRPSCCPANYRRSSNFTQRSLDKLRSIDMPD